MAGRTFPNEDEEAQHCLSVLRDGTPDEKIVARGRLATIFARRHLFEEAAALYEGNIRAGVRSPELFERLSEAYLGLGDAASAEAALTEAQRLAGTRAAIPTPAPAVPGARSGTSAEESPAQHTAPSVEPTPDAGDGDETARRKARALCLVDGPPEFGRSEDDDLSSAAGPDAGRRRAKLGAPRPLTILAGVLFGAIVPIVLLALLVINPLGLYLEGRAAGPTIDGRSDRVPTIKIAPGMSATWYLLAGRSVSGLWATTGLALALDERLPGADRVVAVTAPRAPTWGETITIVERRGQGRANQGTIVPMTLDVPDGAPPAGTMLTGRITGDLTAPRLSESSQFNTTTERIDLPIQLVVVPQYELWLDRFVNTVSMFFDDDRWLLVSIGAVLSWCVLAVAVALLARARPA